MQRDHAPLLQPKATEGPQHNGKDFQILMMLRSQHRLLEIAWEMSAEVTRMNTPERCWQR